MRISFRRGYTVYSTPGNVTYVALHSGPALETVTSRDENSETVASLCWLKTGGKLVVSGLSRKMSFGIDFNRGIPPKRDALKLFEDFMKDENRERLFEFRKKYAWSAASEDDYKRRLGIYRSFWEEVKKGDFVVLVHRCYTRMKNVPMLMDFTSFDGKGIDKGILEEAVKEVNRKNEKFFKKIEKEYKAVTLIEQERVARTIERVYGKFVLGKRNSSDHAYNIHADMEVIRKLCPKDVFEKLSENFSPRNFLYACKKALENADTPRVTVEHVFKGLRSIGPKKQLLSKRRKVINVESTAFLNFWYPHKAAEMITDVVERIRNSTT